MHSGLWGRTGVEGDLVGKVALAGHSRQPEDPLQSLAHTEPWGQSQGMQQGRVPLEEEFLKQKGMEL